jgi:hypothetical protein
MLDPSPDSESARKALQTSGARKRHFAGRGGDRFRKSLRCRLEFVPRGSGVPRRGHQRAHGSSQAEFSVRTTEALSRTPYR